MTDIEHSAKESPKLSMDCDHAFSVQNKNNSADTFDLNVEVSTGDTEVEHECRGDRRETCRHESCETCFWMSLVSHPVVK